MAGSEEGSVKNVSFITTCKGRLHHIKETLPTLLAEKPAEIIVVDYGCPQNTAQWVEENHPEVKLVKVTDDPGFCLPRARNLGAAAASSQWLVFIDVDIKVTPGWVAWMMANLKSQSFYRSRRIGLERDQETYGTVIVESASFNAVEGYDEAFRGWGGEDDDLYKRLLRRGFAAAQYPASFDTALSHDDMQRLAFHDVKDKDVHHIVNQYYMQLKFQVMDFYELRNNPEIKVREQIMADIKSTVRTWVQSGSSTPNVMNLELKGVGWLPLPYSMQKVLNLSITLTKSEN